MSNRWKAMLAFSIAVVFVMLMDISLIPSNPSPTILPRNTSRADAVQMSSTTMALAPGDLPGYTGWARPEETLAGFFTIMTLSTHEPKVGEEFSINLWCHRHGDCSSGSSLFYLRAYGPSVIPGVIKNEGRGRYKAIFTFPDPGFYTVEVVLTFSNPPAIEDFPLPPDQDEPPYEGYPLPGFPLQVFIRASNDDHPINSVISRCTSKQLLDPSPMGPLTQARWKVTRKSNAPDHITTATRITKSGYLHNFNSLGIQMEYEYRTCSLIPTKYFQKDVGSKNPFTICGDKTFHVIFVGDSVMRVQKDRLDEMVQQLPIKVVTSYVSLHGGFRRVEKLEPTFPIKLADIERRAAQDTKILLFNTGLHDIHRLCGNEWKDDRYTYLDQPTLDSGKFSCTKEYRAVIHDLALVMEKFHADLKIFQTTTAAWPKYGNYGFEWPIGGQVMPVTPDFVPFFNEIALEVMAKQFRDSFLIMDGYWITYSRPDNREVGTVGSKLSHPGLEVQSAMSRIFAMLILEKFCSSL